MKSKILIVLCFFSIFIGIGQNIKTNKFELYLNDYTVSEVSISKGMYMTENTQYFYEGKIEVNYIDSNTTKSYQFYFSLWDKEYKEFIVKDLNFIEVSRKFTFKDNKSIIFKDVNNAETLVDLSNNSNIDYAILSSMLIWLEHFPKEIK